MKRIVPRFGTSDWTGCDLAGDLDCHGRVLIIEWLGVVFQLCIGRIKR